MSRKPSLPQLVAVLELFARFHPARLGVLLGNVSVPDMLEISDLLQGFSGTMDLGVRISGGQQSTQAEKMICLTETVSGIIESIGGWGHIHRMTNEVKRDISPTWWQEAENYTTYITPGGQVHDGTGGMGRRLFSPDGRHGICERTIRRRFRKLLRIVAVKLISISPSGELTDLIREAPENRIPT